MKHTCVARCEQIVAERAKGGPTPHWNSLTYIEQAEWLAQEHEWRVMSILHRAVRAAKVLFGHIE